MCNRRRFCEVKAGRERPPKAAVDVVQRELYSDVFIGPVNSTQGASEIIGGSRNYWWGAVLYRF